MRREEVGAEPALVGPSGALPHGAPRHPPRLQAGRVGDQVRRPVHLVAVGVAGAHASGTEWAVKSTAGVGEIVQGSVDPLGHELGEPRRVVPVVDGDEGQAGRRPFDRLGRPVEVLARAPGGVVGGEDEADDPVDTPADELGRSGLDRGLGVLGPEARR